MKHDADESSFGICAQNIPSSDATPRGGNHESNTSGDASAPFATLDQTVSALKDDVPGGSLERLGEPSRYLTVVSNASGRTPTRRDSRRKQRNSWYQENSVIGTRIQWC